MSFQALGISDSLLRAIADYGYQDPTFGPAVSRLVEPLLRRTCLRFSSARSRSIRPTTGGVKGRRKSKKDKLRQAAARARELDS